MRLSSVLGALVFSTLAACGGSTTSSSKEPTAPAPTATVEDDPSCPVSVPGTSVTVEDTDTGAAMVFVTTGDAAELRKRVAAMATMHNDHHGSMGPLPTGDEAGVGHDHAAHGGHAGHDMGGGGGEHTGHGMGGGGGEHAGHAGGMISVHSGATAEDIDGGVRLVFVAAPSDVPKLQEELRMHAQHLSSGTCEMSHH
jgi:hypothetical protein